MEAMRVGYRAVNDEITTKSTIATIEAPEQVEYEVIGTWTLQNTGTSSGRSRDSLEKLAVSFKSPWNLKVSS